MTLKRKNEHKVFFPIPVTGLNFILMYSTYMQAISFHSNTISARFILFTVDLIDIKYIKNLLYTIIIVCIIITDNV